MVIIDGKKFACGVCIKGHRSTSCSHTDRTLVEIGKKGRPPTQCAHCRELRKTSRVHSKCMCGDRPTQTTRPMRILPNGTKSLLEQNEIDTTQLVNQILNPCTCSTGGKCCCAAPAHPTVGTRAKNPKKKINHGDTPSGKINAEQPVDGPLIQSSSRSSCCAGATSTEPVSVDSQSGPSRSFPSTVATTFHPYTTSNTFPLPSIAPVSQGHPNTVTDSTFNPNVTQHPSTFESSSFSTQPALFTPRTAGTALCFCGIHCPCPGCVLHDPLGLKFQPGSEVQCPTSMRNSEGCIAGLDLPTVNGLLNLSPISESFPKMGSSSSADPAILPQSLPPSQMQIPGVSETFGIPSTSTEASFSLFEQSFNAISDDQRYLQTSVPTSSVSGCCNVRPQSIETNINLVGGYAMGGQPGETSQGPPHSQSRLGGCCNNQSTVSLITNSGNRAGCCGGSSGADGRSESHHSQGSIGGCCGSKAGSSSQSDQGPGIASSLGSCGSSQALPTDFELSQYAGRSRNFSLSSSSTHSSYLSNEALDLPSLSFNQVNLLQDQVI
ncbi:hypothetical protein PGT21_024198 [Puccinia graminis f. sp. tritici]|uniref:Copper-fist domain-containing protein n=1 Tax=Puccinia graminis f. sp. tritici TaxID=56615 RepID=A0A5B0PGZ1_PUCGR|nr:hypothetical protein PGT21_024198 [Puccinia graminis f. sp. tritici]KAA1123483.1 hypothetical protein PGTUg99_019447 [Puccinia graminis f. sp. tritici]